MGIRARFVFGFCAAAFVLLNLRLYIRTSFHQPLQVSRHSVFPHSGDEYAAASIQFWCKDRHPSCHDGAIKSQCRANSTIREFLCKETCGSCQILANTVSHAVAGDVMLMKEPVFVCRDERLDCQIPGFEKMCEVRTTDVVHGCQASCAFCNSSSFAGSNPLLHCADYLSLCPLWAQQRRCTLPWMSSLCQSSCGGCDPADVEKDIHVVPLAMLSKAVLPGSTCRDYHLDCPDWKNKEACARQRDFMTLHCAYTCGYCSEVATGGMSGEDNSVIKTRLGVNNAPREWYLVFSPPPPPTYDDGPVTSYTLRPLEIAFCADKDFRCAQWAGRNECDNNYKYMVHNCPSPCGWCETVWREAVPHTTTLMGHLAMPSIGLGTAGMGSETTQAVLTALKLGYRHIDTAQAEEWYQEALVGEALKKSSVPRAELFITTKLHPRDHGYESTLKMFNRSLERLHTDYIDLFLLHYPDCWGDLCGDKKPQGTWRDSWQALEFLKSQKKVLAIGVSNFDEDQLRELLKVAVYKPAVVQANSDPLNPNWVLQTICRRHQVAFVAYSSLGTQHLKPGQPGNPVLNHPVIRMLADKHHKSPAQVVLVWALQHGMVVIPRSTNHDHLKQNLRLNFSLTKEELLQIDQITRPPKQIATPDKSVVTTRALRSGMS